MSNENNTLIPQKIEPISNILAPFWDGLQEVSDTLDTVRKIGSVLETLCSTDNELEAYNLILAMYGVIAIEIPPAISELAPYPDAIKRFIIEFLLDIDDLLIDYESEE